MVHKKGLTTIEVDGVYYKAKYCRKCNALKVLEEFEESRSGIGGRKGICNACANGFENNRLVANGFRRLTTVELKKAEEKARNILLIGGDIVTLECEGISVSIRRCPECRYMRSVVDYIEGLDVCNDCMALIGSGVRVQRATDIENGNTVQEARIGSKILYITECSECGVRLNSKITKRCSTCKKEFIRVHGQNRRARIKALPHTLTVKEKLEIMARGCFVTGEKDIDKLALDHLVPIVWGWGGTTKANCIALRRDLNASKHASNVFEWLKREDIRAIADMERVHDELELKAQQNGITYEDLEIDMYWYEANKREVEGVKAAEKEPQLQFTAEGLALLKDVAKQ
ncbi:hypothetical protein B5P41_06385 [Bacillus sp. SRB_28]|nr:hypothetical protein B5P41_06385 [Bacillus sp. SRB_28]